MKVFGVSEVAELRLVGGGAKNALWGEIIASCFGVPVTVVEEAETAACGAALQAAAMLHLAGDTGTGTGSGGEVGTDGAGQAARMRAFMAEHAPATGKTILPVTGDAHLYRAAFELHEKRGGKLFG